MDYLDKIIFFIIGLIILVFARKMFRSAVNVLLLIMIIAFILLLFTGNANFLTNPRLETIFKDRSVIRLEQMYCGPTSNKRDKAVCTCIINPVYDQMRHDFTDQQIYDLEQDRPTMNKVVQQILNKHHNYIEHCLIKNNAEGFHIIDRFQKTRDVWDL